MTLIEFIEELEAEGVELWVQDDKLKYRGEKDYLTPEVLGRLKEQKAEVIALQKERLEKATLCPLSRGQSALWFLNQLAPTSPAYNVGFATRIHSRIDAAAMERAFNQLTQRHATLRTTFPKRSGGPVQEVHKKLSPIFEKIPVLGMGREELSRTVFANYEQPFDLDNGPLLRGSLFTVADNDHVLSITVHHLVCDAWSLWLLLEELGTLYLMEVKAPAPALTQLNTTYPEYVRWQRQLLAGGEGEKLWQFWQETLKGEVPVLNLPTDRPRPPVQTFNGTSYRFQLSPQLTAQLKAFATSEGTTLYMTLLAAFQVLLHRYSGQEDVVMGSPTTGRTKKEFADILGDFINTVVLRSSSAGDPTFRAFLTKCSESALNAIAHQDYPFPLIVDKLHVERDPSRSPMFQVLFNFQKPQRFQDVIELWVAGETGNRVQWGGLSLGAFPLPQQEGQFDLTLEMVEAKTSLFGVFKYNTDLYDEATIGRLTGHFETLLAGIVAAPDTKISLLPMIQEPERKQLLDGWNETKLEYPRTKCVHQLFEAQAARIPQSVAVMCEGESLTYTQLNAQADELAARLRALGVGPDVLVGLCVERSIGMMVGLMGILKAGGAYLPLDPSHPQDRLEFILRDASISLLCTQKTVLAKLNFSGQPADAHGQSATGSPVKAADLMVLRLDSATEALAPNAGKTVAPENLAYVIYTSGSTGQPKGVQLEHRGIVNFLTSMAIEPGFTAKDTVLALTTLSFDIAVLELFLPLSVGGKIAIAKRETAVDPERLSALINESHSTVIQATPATWRLLIDSGWQGSANLKILVGGEALPAELAAQLLTRCGELWNMYGPTETTVWSATVRVTDPERISIGKPIGNTDLLVLHPGKQLAPIGVPGELYIGGDGLARGYLKRPALTEKAFFPHPFRSEPGARIYKTGDLVRYRADGSLEFLGRVDHQVKIRGYRVELGEIESAIRLHPGVKETVVVVREDSPGDKRLVAYLIPTVKEVSPVGELRGHLSGKLPDYMVPAAFVAVEKWPLTGSGKIDRKALPKPNQEKSAAPVAAAPSAPAPTEAQTPTQVALVGIWANLLGLAKPGLDDNLFHVGGHSLIAVRLVAEIHQSLSVKLPVATVFQHPTIRELSSIVDSKSVPKSQITNAPLVKPAVPPVAAQVAPPVFALPAKSTEQTDAARGLTGGIHRRLDLGNEGLFQGTLNRMLQFAARLAPTALRARLHRWRGVNLGDNVLIGYDTIIETSYPWLVSIGSGSAVGMRVVMIGHFLGAESLSRGQRKFSIEIGDNVWIGPGSLILPNVSIGSGSVVAAGSVVSSSVPPNTLVQGNPARAVARCPQPIKHGVPFEEFVKHLEPLSPGEAGSQSQTFI